MGKELAWIPIAFIFVQLIGLSRQESWKAPLRANYEERQNQEKQLQLTALQQLKLTALQQQLQQQMPQQRQLHSAQDLCDLPMVVGRCRYALKQFYFNSATGKCTEFLYGGCGGNANRFDTLKACQQQCSRGSIHPSSKLNLTRNYYASSKYKAKYSAEKAVQAGKKKYWCSEKNQGAPQFWWISFADGLVDIVEIAFEEKYPGAEFVFFASDAEECDKAQDGRELISGTREEISRKRFTNGQGYHCYGLKITKLAPAGSSYGDLATVKNFTFYYKDIDDCASIPCHNNGTCIDGVNTFKCQCLDGFSGQFCDKDIDECASISCRNNGTCMDGVNSYRCQCRDGFSGQFCETDIDDCASKPCFNNGTCKDEINSFTCQCPTGFAGDVCETSSTDIPNMLMLGSKSNLTMKYSASSEQDSRFSADKAVEVGRKWWLSLKNDEVPVYWWIAFVVEPVEIVSITFAEAYPGAEFEFFASSTNKCAKTGPVLIKGNRAEIDNKMFKNGRPYYCYGLRYTKLADSDWGYKFASLRKFDFQFKGGASTQKPKYTSTGVPIDPTSGGASTKTPEYSSTGVPIDPTSGGASTQKPGTSQAPGGASTQKPEYSSTGVPINPTSGGASTKTPEYSSTGVPIDPTSGGASTQKPEFSSTAVPINPTSGGALTQKPEYSSTGVPIDFTTREESIQTTGTSYAPDGSAVGVVVDLSSFTINYNLRVDKVIGQCNVSFQELNKTKEDFQKKIEEFRKEAEEMKKELDNKTRTFEEMQNEWKTQLDEKTAEIATLLSELKTCRQRHCGGDEVVNGSENDVDDDSDDEDDDNADDNDGDDDNSDEDGDDDVDGDDGDDDSDNGDDADSDEDGDDGGD